MSDAVKRLRPKTIALVAFSVCASVSGNLLLSRGLKNQAEQLSQGPLGYLLVLMNPWVAAGVGLLICWTLSRLALLSWADLSYVLPVTAIGYVLTVLAGKLVLAEQVSWKRWMGTLLIVAGVSLVGRTPIRTTAPGKAAG